MTDLSTRYLGLPLSSPLVASASPLSDSVDGMRRLEDAGAAAVVMHSLFEEQIALERHHLERSLGHGVESFAESLSYFPDVPRHRRGADSHVEHVRRAVAAVGIPVIASLNGVSPGGWTTYATQLEAAGAAAIELNGTTSRPIRRSPLPSSRPATWRSSARCGRGSPSPWR